MTTVTEIVHFLYTMHSALCPTIDSIYGHTEASLTRCEMYMYMYLNIFGGKSSSFIYVIILFLVLQFRRQGYTGTSTWKTQKTNFPTTKRNKRQHFLRFRAAPYKY